MVSWGVARRRVRRFALGGALLLAPAAATAQASAATISVDKPCYVNTATQAQMTVSGSGFVPGDEVSITSSDGTVDSVVPATAQGTISTTTGAPYPTFKLPGAKAVALTATDDQTSGITATTQVMTTRLWVKTKAESTAVPITRKITWYFAGFTSGKLIFGHYIHNNQQAALARFGRAQGPCGVLKTKARLFPGGHPHFKKYGVQIDDSRRYDKNATPRLRFRLHTALVFR